MKFNCKIVMYAIFTAIPLSLIACSKDTNKPFNSPNSAKFNDVVESGIYVNVIEDRSDTIIVTDNSIQFESFDNNELTEYYDAMLKDLELDKDKFCNRMAQPYMIETVAEEETKGAYKIEVPLFGEDMLASYALHYDIENKLIMFRKDTYKLQAEKEKNESN